MTDAVLALKRPETLTGAVARSIGEAIVRGTFAPGQALPEVPLAAQLGTSRGTVREALRLLADQGLVEVVRHRGAFAAELTSRRAREIFTLRAELEAFAVRLVFERGGYPAATLAELEATLARLGAAADDGGDAVDVFAVAELDMRFHDLLSRDCGHQALLDLLAALRLQMRRFIVYTKLVNSDIEPEPVTHRRLLDAVRASDADHAASEVRGHILAAGEQLLRKLAELELIAPDGATTEHQGTPGDQGGSRRSPGFGTEIGDRVTPVSARRPAARNGARRRPRCPGH